MIIAVSDELVAVASQTVALGLEDQRWTKAQSVKHSR